MGKPAAKKGDKIVSATPGDIHIVMVPSPGGPVPTPLPHPCSSDIKMKLAKKVNVQGKAGATKGSRSKHMPPHFPTPPGVSFQRPPKNEAEVFTASSNVNYEGRGAAMLGDTGMMCSDPSDTPVGVLVIPPGTVYVGGGMSGGAEARAQARIAAMKAAAAKCHDWICANMPMGEDREEAHRKVCKATGHPVDVATGKVFTGLTILRLRGRIPVLLAIDYSTARAHEDGPFGHGWRLALERHLLITDDFIGHRNEHGHFAAFAPIGLGEEARNTAEGLTLRHHGHYLAVRNAEGLDDVFLLPEGDQKGVMLPLAGMRDVFGNSVRLHYDRQRLARVTDSAGREVQLTYSAANRVTQVLLKDDPRVAARPIVTCRYDAAGDLIAVGDPLGHERRMAYDRHLLVCETDRNGFSFYFAYDDLQRCILTWGDGGALYRRMSYDPERQLSHVIDSQGGQTVHRLSAAGQVEDTIDPLGHEWSAVLDEEGHVLSRTDPLGRSWTFAYDDAGRLMERNDPAGESFTAAYDEVGRVRQMGYEFEAPLEIDHDAASGMVKRIAIGDGPVLTYDWTENGDLAEIRRDDRVAWRYAYDARGNRTLVEQPGGIRQVHDYEHAGRLARIENNRGLAIGFGWDAAGRLTTVQRPGCEPEQRSLDCEGNIVCRRRGQRQVDFTYTGWNLPVAAKGALRQEHGLAYDQELRLVSLRTGSGAEHRFAYDLCGRPVSHRYPDGGIERTTCDAAGRALRAIDRAGREATFAYDDAGNVTERQESDGQVSRWSYDDRRRLAQTSNATVACETVFDEGGRASRQLFTFVDGPELALSLEDGWLTAEDTGLRFAHLGDGVRVGATSCSAWTRPVLYLPGEQSVEIRYPNGVRETIRFHASGRRLSQTLTGPQGETIDQRRYGYDSAGRLVTVDDTLRGKASYVYDDTERLREVVRSGSDGRPERYHYDAAENLSRGDDGWHFDQADHLITRPGRSYAYDRCGNRSEEREPGQGTTRYHYDARNRLVAVDLPDGRQVDYGYDATGRRVRKRIGDLTTLYLWNGDLLVAERRSDGAARTYIHSRRGNALLAWVDEAADSQRSYFVHNDHLGRPLEVTDEEGGLVWAADYDAFGAAARLIVGEVEQPVRAPGQYADAETGLYYNHQRYLDPAAVRYLSEDPLGLDAGFNPYAYCPNPIAQIDPLGYCSGSNPAYDPKQAELEAIRRLYYGSEGHQLMTRALQSGDIEDVCLAGEALGNETGWHWEPWTHAVNGRSPGEGGDPGMIDWENRRVLIDLNAPTPKIAETMSHEYNALRNVQDQAAQRGIEVPTTRHEALRLIPSAQNFPAGHRHEVMDSYVEDPEGFERFVADSAAAEAEDP